MMKRWKKLLKETSLCLVCMNMIAGNISMPVSGEESGNENESEKQDELYIDSLNDSTQQYDYDANFIESEPEVNPGWNDNESVNESSGVELNIKSMKIVFDANVPENIEVAGEMQDWEFDFPESMDNISFQLPKSVYQREHFEFIGWSTTKDNEDIEDRPETVDISEYHAAVFVPDEAELINWTFFYDSNEDGEEESYVLDDWISEDTLHLYAVWQRTEMPWKIVYHQGSESFEQQGIYSLNEPFEVVLQGMDDNQQDSASPKQIQWSVVETINVSDSSNIDESKRYSLQPGSMIRNWTYHSDSEYFELLDLVEYDEIEGEILHLYQIENPVSVSEFGQIIKPGGDDESIELVITRKLFQLISI